MQLVSLIYNFFVNFSDEDACAAAITELQQALDKVTSMFGKVGVQNFVQLYGNAYRKWITKSNLILMGLLHCYCLANHVVVLLIAQNCWEQDRP